MYKIRTLNNISSKGLDRLPRESFEVGDEVSSPDALLVRSASLHDEPVPETLKAVGRAGAGVNNIPVDAMSERGIPVFNAPGANANAVKELVLAGMLMAARNIPDALRFAGSLEGDDEAIHEAMEAGKKRFVGTELPDKTLGVVGLGAIGVKVANDALALGMNVVGFDPKITVTRAWQLHYGVEEALSLEDLLSRSDYVTFHVPLTDDTRDMLSSKRLDVLKKGATILNFARDGIVDSEVIREGLQSGQVGTYVCDFPNRTLLDQDRVIALPHLGASTVEAQENCAIMVADQLRDYLENGNIVNSVNFPETIMPRTEGYRMCIANNNVPNMLGQISSLLGQSDLNILDMINKSRGNLAYTVVDVDKPVPDEAVERAQSIEGVLSVRVL